MIIGLTGSFGAGKGVVVDHLKTKGFRHYAAREFIVEEINKRGLPIDRNSMVAVANDLRSKYGPTYIIETLFQRAVEAGEDAVIESLRAVAEADCIHKHGGVVVGIDADPELRYRRIVGRGSETDHVTFEEWKEQERRESNPDDPTKQDIFGALRLSDHIIENNGSLSDLHSKIDAVLQKIGHDGSTTSGKRKT